MRNNSPEKRCCDACGHTGTDGGSTEESYCGACGQTVPYPKEDLCPACAATNCMLIACPECGGEYSLAERYGALADEIDRLRGMVGGHDDLSQALIDRLENLEVQAVREIAPGWVGIPTVEWDSIMGPNAQVTGAAPTNGERSDDL